MTEITLCKTTMKVNKREETFARIIKQDAERLLEYFHLLLYCLGFKVVVVYKLY